MKRKIYVILVTALAAMFVTATATALTAIAGSKTQAELNVFGEGLQAQYKVGSTVEIPKGELTILGQKYDAQTVVITPKGKAYIADSVVADCLGLYTIEYRATVDGKLYTKQNSFETYNDLYTVTGNGTATYGAETRYQTGIEGLQVSLHEGAEFRFNEIIDLRDFDYETPFIDMFATPNTLGQRDVHAFTMRLTDAYNPNNYVTIDAKSVNSDGGSNLWWMNFIFVAAGPNENSLKGIEWGKNLVHTDNSFGFPIMYSLYGTIDNKNSIGTNVFSLCYDITENKIYGPYGKADNYAIDLDDPQYFPKGWEGFTTGEVYLSIKGKSYYATTFDFTIKKIGNSDLTKATICDREKPEIQIDCSEIPAAGLNNYYPVFAATALDGYSGEVPVTVKVFYNYMGQNRYELSVKDGYFRTAKKGVYTIEYSAIDGAGNAAVETISVLCDGQPRDLALSVGAAPVGGKTGVPVSLSEVKVSGGVGTVSLKTTVSCSDEKVAVRGNTFVPHSAGTYLVEVTATDISGQAASKTYSVEIVKNDRPVIADASFPDFMIEGGTYCIPAVQAHDDTTQKTYDCTVTINGKSLQSAIYTVPIGTKTVKIVYSAEGETREYSIPVIKYTSPASLFISDGSSENSKAGVLLSGGAFKFANELSNKLKIKVTVNNGSKLTLSLSEFNDIYQAATVTMAAGEHTVEYNSVAKKIKVDGKIVEEIALNGGIRLHGSVQGSAVITSVNGQSMGIDAEKAETEINVDGIYELKAAIDDKIEVLTAKAYNMLLPNEMCRVTVTDPNGNVIIQGLNTNKVYSFEVKMYGTYTISYYTASKKLIYAIQAVDRVAPTLTMQGTLPKSVNVGETFTVPFATGRDEKDGIVKVSCFVVFPSGMIRSIKQCAIANTEDGTIVKFTVAGEYTIRYIAIDLSGNYTVSEFALVVKA